MKAPKRRNRLPKPGLQLKLIGVFLGLGVACTLVQFALLSRASTRLALSLPDGRQWLGPFGDVLWTQLGVSLALLIPLTLVVGTIVTFRVAGPIHHFERHLRDLLSGRDPGDLRIRDADELPELCALINRVLEKRGVVKIARREVAGIPDGSASPGGQNALVTLRDTTSVADDATPPEDRASAVTCS